MRIGLISAIRRTPSGELRAELMLAGKPVLAWQVDFLRGAGAQRIICLVDGSHEGVLRIQHQAERAGVSFHVLRGFAAVPALVRADDDLIVLCDGLVPDGATFAALSPPDRPRHFVASFDESTFPALASTGEFERIEGSSLWAGLLIMRGASAARLSDFPADADAVSLLLRLALQARTERRDLPVENAWLLADSADAVTREEQALVARFAPAPDWRAPFVALAQIIARETAGRGAAKGSVYVAGVAAALLLTATGLAAYGALGFALALAAAGLLAAQVWRALTVLMGRLRRTPGKARDAALAGVLADGLAAAILFLALSQEAGWTSLAICGPLLIGLARLAERQAARFAPLAGDRAALMAALCPAAIMGVLGGAIAACCTLLMVALLVRQTPE